MDKFKGGNTLVALRTFSDNVLLESYNKAKKMDLEADFLSILETEIKRRNLPFT